jgi:flavin reductase (DIM6/NTAB) family NADH-FMN oxidoreductase RutF
MHKADDLTQIDTVLRLVDREVWVVTAAGGGRRGGLVATWVGPASINRERPVILAGLGPNHHTTELVQESRAFVAHLLRSDQIETAWNFAKDSGHERDKFSDLAATEGQTGAPILTDCLAWSDCRVFARYDAGDRLVFWADVVAAGQSASGPALCEQELFRRLSEEQRQVLMKAREADVVALRPGHERWRSRNPW